METDNKFYQLFTKAPEMLFMLLNMDPNCPYTMKSITFKELEQRSDGVLEPTEEGEPVFVVEFQGWNDKTIYDRLVIEMASYRKTYSVESPIRGILIFTEEQFDPKSEPWHFLTKGEEKGIYVFYLEKLLIKLEEENENHPLVLLFKPYRITDQEILRNSAKGWYSQLENATLPTDTKEIFCTVFFRWFTERFKDLSNEEVYSMLATLTPYKETRAYQEMLEREQLGEIKGKIATLQELHSEGLLPKEVFETRTEVLKEQLKQFELKTLSTN